MIGIVGRPVEVAAAAAEGQDRAVDQPRVVLGAGSHGRGRRGPAPRAARCSRTRRRAAIRRSRAASPSGFLRSSTIERLLRLKLMNLPDMPGLRLPSRHGAQQVAARRLDLDDVGAVVGQRARADRADDDGRQVDDAHAGQRAVRSFGELQVHLAAQHAVLVGRPDLQLAVLLLLAAHLDQVADPQRMDEAGGVAGEACPWRGAARRRP